MDIAATYFRHRSTVLLLLVAPIVYVGLGPAAAPPIEVLLTGIAFVAAGAVLRMSSARCLGRGARVHRADVRGELVTWGPYAWSRNPLYLAAALILVGVGMQAGMGWYGLLILPATVLLYTPVIRHEESAIHASAGAEFEAYRGRVNRWLGFPAAAPPASEREPWSEVLRREKGLAPGLVLACVGVHFLVSGQLPVRQLLLTYAPWLPPSVIGLVLLFVGAAVNSIGLLRKQRKHARRRARLRAEQAADEELARSAVLAGSGNDV